MSRKSVVFCFQLWLSVAAAPDALMASNAPSLDQLVEEIAAQEHRVHDLAVKGFSLSVETKSSEKGQWEASKEFWAGDAWSNGERGSKFRIDGTHVQPWPLGKSPWAELRERLSWDGQTGRTVHLAFGAPGFAHALPSATIAPARPLELQGKSLLPFATGQAFSLDYYDGGGGVGGRFASLSAQLAAGIGKPGITVTTERIDDADTLKVSCGNGIQNFSGFWIEPAKGYAIRRIENWCEITFNGEHLSRFEHVEVSDLVQAAPGVWYPAKATWVESLPSGMLRRLTYAAKSVVINAPGFDETAFSAPIPPNYLVDDQVRHTSYYSADGKATTKAIDDSVRNLRQQEKTINPSATAPSGPAAPTSGASLFPSLSRSRSALAETGPHRDQLVIASFSADDLQRAAWMLAGMGENDTGTQLDVVAEDIGSLPLPPRWTTFGADDVLQVKPLDRPLHPSVAPQRLAAVDADLQALLFLFNNTSCVLVPFP